MDVEDISGRFRTQGHGDQQSVGRSVGERAEIAATISSVLTMALA
jgi:hypothetical protein